MNILICEDERLIALDLCASIGKMGHNIVSVCHCGKDLIDKAKTFSPDLILTDISLAGDMSGIEAIKLIKAWKYIPFIYISGLKDENTFNLAMETEPKAFISKPYSYKELESHIDGCLHKNISESKENLFKL